MRHPYQSFDPVAEVNGETLHAFRAAFNVDALALDLLKRHGLPVAPQAGRWYPLQGWLDLLATVEATYGPETVYAVGLQVFANCRWPEGLSDLESAVRALDEACRLNVQGEPIGYYRAEACGPQGLRVECRTPTPKDFERGIVTGLVRQFKPDGSLRVGVTWEPTPEVGDPLFKRFLVRW
ncbi:hypothetical protein GCM10022409_47560 [Hymenobacter glaciei]|uniref:Uncharacterized protein n=1 Tax=Hymenobacter glaciei TaxID=877209 RepID=A0ABP7UYB0_9BACT